MIRRLFAAVKAVLRQAGARHHHFLRSKARPSFTARLSNEGVPMSVLLTADTGADFEFDPERLGLTASTPEL